MVEIMLCVNNHLGHFTGKVSDIQMYKNGESILDLDPGLCDGVTCSIHDERVKISRKSFPIRGYKTYVGNIFWDQIIVKDNVAADILNYLKKLNKWGCMGGLTEFFNNWENNHIFTEKDFQTI